MDDFFVGIGYSFFMINEIAAYLKKGEPVGMPTETVYGLAAPIFDPIAVQKIFSLKGRPQDNPLIAHVSSLSMVETIAKNIPPSFWLLAERFWPGPLTLVLSKKECVPAIVSAGQSTIAVRMPSHPLALQLIDLVGSPLVAPSANISGRPSPTCAAHVLEDFQIPVLDGGECQIGIESTILSLVSETAILLRPGSVTKEQIEAVLGVRVALPGIGGPILAPGMKYRHYAPNALLHIVDSLPTLLPNDAFVISRDPVGFVHRRLDSKEFYAHLRAADLLSVKEIWVLLDPISSSNDALMNRLFKASSKA